MSVKLVESVGIGIVVRTRDFKDHAPYAWINRVMIGIAAVLENVGQEISRGSGLSGTWTIDHMRSLNTFLVSGIGPQCLCRIENLSEEAARWLEHCNCFYEESWW